MYTEVVLIAQYVWQIPTRLNCPWVTPLLRTRMEQVCCRARFAVLLHASVPPAGQLSVRCHLSFVW
jgi:hypothetical protein